jgi:hypothetical protein
VFLVDGLGLVKARDGVIVRGLVAPGSGTVIQGLVDPDDLTDSNLPRYIRKQGFWVLIFAAVLTWIQNRDRVKRAALRQARAASAAEALFDWIEVFLPKRVTREEIGDGLEQIHRWASSQDGKYSTAKIYCKAVSVFACVVVNSIRYVVSALLGKG